MSRPQDIGGFPPTAGTGTAIQGWTRARAARKQPDPLGSAVPSRVFSAVAVAGASGRIAVENSARSNAVPRRRRAETPGAGPKTSIT